MKDLEEKVESKIELSFAIAIFDCDDLKLINDNYGHDKGNIYLKNSSNLICRVFEHSEVYRIGGDEFAVIVRDGDYNYLDKLMSLLDESNTNSIENGGVVIAGGAARYTNERYVADVFAKADAKMYENKRHLKEAQA